MDNALIEYSQGEIGIEEVFRYIYDTYSKKGYERTTEEEILRAVSTISGYDFKPFFDAYVTGNGSLPIKQESGELIIIWDEMVKIEKQD